MTNSTDWDADFDDMQLSEEAPSEPNNNAEDTTTLQRPSVIEIQDITWAIGLEWQVSREQNSSPRDARSEARRLATSEEFGADFLCISKTATARPEYGFGNSQLGHENGQPALAPLIAGYLTRQGGNAIATAEIDKGRAWWIFSIANGAIHSDTVCNDEAEAREICQSLSDEQLIFWNDTYAPTAWNIGNKPHWTEETLASIVENHFNSSATLQPVSGWGWVLSHYLGGASKLDKKQIALLGLSGLLLAGMYGYTVYQDYVEEQHAEELARQAALAAAGKENTLPQRDPIWAKAPAPALAINTCVNGIANLIVAIPGWEQTNIMCAGASVSAEFEKTNGSISSFFEFSKAKNWPEPAFDDAGNRATVSLSTEELWARGEQALLPPQYLKPVIADFFQRSQHTLTASDQSDHLAINWKTVTSPTDWASALEKLPGAVLDRLEFAPGTYEWTFNMRVFSWLPPPPPPQPS